MAHRGCQFCGLVVAILAVLIGLLLSGQAKNTGVIPMLTRANPQLAGMAPFMYEGDLATYAARNLPDLTDQVALVTGANHGLGMENARFLAEKGAKVILACRNITACREIEKKSRGRGVAKFVDLASLSSVEALAEEVLHEFSRLDMLVLNAGIVLQPFGLTVDGIEQCFAVNHVAHFLLFRQLRPLLEHTAITYGRASVVVVSSASHYDSYPHGVSLSLAGINDREKYDANWAYGQSKLANVLFAQEAARQFQKTHVNVFVNSVHPGLVHTHILAHIPDLTYSLVMPVLGSTLAGVARWLTERVLDQFNKIMWSAEVGALTQTWLAANPEVIAKGIEHSGAYYHPILHPMPPNAQHASPSSHLPHRLWAFTEDILKLKGFAPKAR